MKTLRAGIIGAGRIAWQYDGGGWDGRSACVTLASCFHRHPQTQLVAVFDPVVSARSAFRSGYKGPGPVAVHESLTDFFAENLDIVAIASPSQYHAAHIAACLDAKVPRLWIEKPVTLDLASFDALRSRVAQMPNPPRTCVNFLRRSLPQLAFMQRHLAQSPNQPCEIKLTLRYSRGLAVNGVHLLDLLGAVTAATSVPPLDFMRAPDPENPQFGLTLCGFPVTVTGQSLGYHLIEFDITDSRGRLSLNRGGQSLTWEAAEPNPDYPGFFRLGTPNPVEGLEPGERAMQEATFRMLCSLVDDSAPPISSLDTAWFSQALLETVNMASVADK